MSRCLSFRFALAAGVSLLLHLGGLVLLDRPAAARPGAGLPLTLTLRPSSLPPASPPRVRMPVFPLPAPLPQQSVPPPAPEPAYPEQQVVEGEAASRAAEADEVWPEWLRAFEQDEDTTFYPASELDVRAAPLSFIDPAMPVNLPADIQNGWVELEVKINEYGVVSDVRVLAADPPGWFDLAAIRSFEHTYWQPAVRDGQFVKSLKRIEVCFGECTRSQAATTEPE